MKTKITLIGLLLQVCTKALASGKGTAQGDMDFMVTIMGVILMVVVLFTVWKAVQKKPEVVELPKQKTLEELTNEEFGDLDAIGPNAFASTKYLGTKQGLDTYLMLAKVDRASIEAEARENESKKMKTMLIIALVASAFITALFLI
ncbi:hypothetical protein R9C00_05490 [Flammeovirgaceae bacterium SG7u.111]|nr:hypothetical protein [Flammeovirgaceae bacterium SG7u.132]WPO36894.1 hypothetical protein R9C00_05490 [Flammeovirgaceae bacterium SG7u.111]